MPTFPTPRDALFGNPPTANHQPDKNDLRAVLEQMQTMFAAGTIKGFAQSVAALPGSGNVADDLRIVVALPQDGGGVYEWSGSAWALVAALPVIFTTDEYALLAQAWAESVTSPDGEVGSKSAKTLAQEAAISETNAGNSAISAEASSAAAGAASGRLDVGSFVELATKFVPVGTDPVPVGKQVAAPGDVVLWRGTGFAYEVLASGASGAHLDYTGAGGVKLNVLPGADGWVSPLQFATSIREGLVAAQTAGFKMIRVPRCDETWTNAVEILEGVKVDGCGLWSKITMTGTNISHFFSSARADVKITNLFLNGNLTGNGSTAAGAAGGHGINFNTCTDVEVSGCIFDNIGRGTTGSSASCIWGNNVDGAVVERNYFLTGNGGNVANVGADVNLSYYCRNLQIRDNYSASEMDTFVSVSAVSVVAEDTTNHIITGNIGVRSDASVSRTGILAPYDAEMCRSVIANNLLENFPANGIYMSAGALNTGETAGASVTGNIIRFCGGSGAMLNISAGLYLSGRAGIAASGNVVEFSGYRRDGVARTYAVAGILVNGSTRAASVVANTVKQSSGAGVEVRNISGSTDMLDVLVGSNILHDNARGGVEVVHALATATISRLHVVGNIITQVANDFDGITYNRSSGALNIPGLRVDGNTIKAASSTTKYGLTTNVAGFPITSIKGNHFIGWVRGLWFASSAVVDREIGDKVVCAENTFEDCTTGIAANIGAGKYALHFDSTFNNCAAETSDASRVLAASRLGGGRYEVRRSAAPTDGAWLQGDKVLRTAPAASGFIGDVCVTAGSPGTWKNYGAIVA